MNARLKPYLRRLLFVMVASLAAVWLINEVAFQIQLRAGDMDRAPQEIELVIPEGTAARVEAGEPVPNIPEEMVFVLGDTLVVRNRDVVAHELGPLLIPANSSASMPMDAADQLVLSCSFKPSKYLGLEIKEPTTLQTRLQALFFAVPPTALIVFLYSLLVRPVKTVHGEAGLANGGGG